MVLNVKPQRLSRSPRPKPAIRDRAAGIGSVSFDGFEVFCTGVRTGSEPLLRSRRLEVEHNLVRKLLEESKLRRQSLDGYAYSLESDLKITKDGLGKPLLLVDGDAGPSISFASTHDFIWAALCRQDRSCGVDCASAKEFDHGYPFQKIFCATEITILRDVTGIRSTENLAAIIWSLKESAVKALGCGFHLVNPLELSVVGLDMCSSMLLSEVRVLTEQSVGSRGLASRTQAIPVRSFMANGEWISVALADANWHSP